MVSNKKTNNKVSEEKNEKYNVLSWKQFKEIKKIQANEQEENDPNYWQYPDYTSQYIFSFLIPLIGFILGAILLSKEDKSEREKGTNCILLGLLSLVVSGVIVAICLSR